jgi:hypothetical protein
MVYVQALVPGGSELREAAVVAEGFSLTQTFVG